MPCRQVIEIASLFSFPERYRFCTEKQFSTFPFVVIDEIAIIVPFPLSLI